jgi:hypothetical protein
MRFFLFVIFLFHYNQSSFAQELKVQLDAVYNMDPELYNGQIFTNVYRRDIDGNQFFQEKNFKKNDLTLSKKSYEDQYINYDVYSQKLLLTYLDENNSQKIIEIPLEHVRSFYIEDNYFEVIQGPDEDYKIYQTFNFNNNKILIYWMKNLILNSGSVYYRYRFTKLDKQMWLLLDGNYRKVNNNKSFLNSFPDDKKLAIKNWLKKNKLKIQKADSSELELFSNYLKEL